MAKSPHTPEFRTQVSKEYLNGLGSYRFLATKYSIGTKTLQDWAAKYRIRGIESFVSKQGNTTYTSQYKTMCVEAVLMILLQSKTYLYTRYSGNGL